MTRNMLRTHDALHPLRHAPGAVAAEQCGRQTPQKRRVAPGRRSLQVVAPDDTRSSQSSTAPQRMESAQPHEAGAACVAKIHRASLQPAWGSPHIPMGSLQPMHDAQVSQQPAHGCRNPQSSRGPHKSPQARRGRHHTGGGCICPFRGSTTAAARAVPFALLQQRPSASS